MVFSRFRRGDSEQAVSFERFDNAFPATPSPEPREWTGADTEQVFGVASRPLTELLASHAVASYLDGLWRFALPGGPFDPRTWNGPQGWARDWPDTGGLRAFGYDWLGRVYGVDAKGQFDRKGVVVRLVPAADAVETTGKPLDGFLLEELPRHRDDMLAAQYFRDWLGSAGGGALAIDECASYRQPLVLGGEDDVPNLERSNLAVHLSLAGQLAAQLRGLPEGTAIDSVRVE